MPAWARTEAYNHIRFFPVTVHRSFTRSQASTRATHGCPSPSRTSACGGPLALLRSTPLALTAPSSSAQAWGSPHTCLSCAQLRIPSTPIWSRATTSLNDAEKDNKGLPLSGRGQEFDTDSPVSGRTPGMHSHGQTTEGISAKDRSTRSLAPAVSLAMDIDKPEPDSVTPDADATNSIGAGESGLSGVNFSELVCALHQLGSFSARAATVSQTLVVRFAVLVASSVGLVLAMVVAEIEQAVNSTHVCVRASPVLPATRYRSSEALLLRRSGFCSLLLLSVFIEIV